MPPLFAMGFMGPSKRIQSKRVRFKQCDQKQEIQQREHDINDKAAEQEHKMNAEIKEHKQMNAIARSMGMYGKFPKNKRTGLYSEMELIREE